MLQDIKTYLLFKNQYCGIEHTSKNGATRLYVAFLKKKKNEIDLKNCVEANSIAELSNILSKDIGVSLLINNEHVITKRVEHNITEPLKLVNIAFPNINLNDFVYEVILQKTIHFVSICRKDYIEELIKSYKKSKISILKVNLGISTLSSITSFFNANEVYTNNSSMSIENSEIISIHNNEIVSPVSYRINGLNIANTHLLSFASALSYIIDNNNYSNFEVRENELLVEYTLSQFFKKFTKFALVFIFSLLLINFMFYNFYFNKVEGLQQTSLVNQHSKSKVIGLSKKIEKSEKIVNDMLYSNSSKSSYYLNHIVNSIPSSIQFSQIDYQPLLKKVKTSEPILIDYNIILISGDSTDSDLFSIWINELESYTWIEKIEIIDYSDLTNHISNFSIKITMKND
jgi:hypothetical protein